MTTISTKSAHSAAIPWVERYRPRALDEVSHHAEIVSTLQNAIETDRLPHLLFYGKPGTGKTSVALALCRQLWHPNQLKSRVLELNASDERGISVVRDKIKHFAGLAVGSGGGGGGGSMFGKGGKTKEEEKKYPNPPYKIIILDEADTVTRDAQSALRRIIEAHSKITRFILICNYVTRIIEPLASRCAKFRFQPLPPSSMIERLTYIATEEKCLFPDGKKDVVLDKILELSGGDMRRAVTALQSAHSLTGAGKHGPIEAEAVAEMAGIPPDEIISALLASIQSNDFKKMQTTVLDTIAEGYAVPSILTLLVERIVNLSTAQLADLEKATLLIKIAEVDKALIDGADETLQLMSVCALGIRCFAKENKTSDQC